MATTPSGGAARSLVPPLALLGVILTFPLYLNQYYIYLITFTLITFISVQGLNVIIGYAGLFSFGQAGFVAFGAYLSVILIRALPWMPFPVTIVIVCAATAMLGVVLGLPCLRLREFYLAMATFAFAAAVVEIIDFWKPLTGGPAGLPVAPPAIGPLAFDSPAELFYLTVGMAVICQLAVISLLRSKIGRAWQAVRDDELAASSMGINVVRFKLAAFAFGSLYAGIGGILYASLVTFIRPDFFSFQMSESFFVILYVGGMGTLYGPLVGSAFITFLPQLLGGFFSQHLGLVYGIVLVLFILLIPRGIVGTAMGSRLVDPLRRMLTRRRAARRQP